MFQAIGILLASRYPSYLTECDIYLQDCGTYLCILHLLFLYTDKTDIKSEPKLKSIIWIHHGFSDNIHYLGWLVWSISRHVIRAFHFSLLCATIHNSTTQIINKKYGKFFTSFELEINIDTQFRLIWTILDPSQEDCVKGGTQNVGGENRGESSRSHATRPNGLATSHRKNGQLNLSHSKLPVKYCRNIFRNERNKICVAPIAENFPWVQTW